MRVAFVLVAVVFSMAPAIVPAKADDVVTLTYARDAGGATVDQSYILVHDGDAGTFLPDPVATVVLFAGGRGRLRIADEQLSVDASNFLVRTRSLIAASGPFNVAVMDVASDFLDAGLFPNGLFAQRTSPQHLEDIKRVIADLRGRFPGLPVWLVGTSRGSISAAHGAAELAPPIGPDGLVLTSSVTVDRPNRNSLNDVDLGAVSVPTLIVAHRNDACPVTPPGDAEAIKMRLTNVPKQRKRVRNFEGGAKAISAACNALSAHGFFGIEPRVVAFIGKWIRDH